MVAVRQSLNLFDKKTAQALLTAAAFALAFWFLYPAWRAIITFLFAVFFAYLLEAPVSRLQGWLKGSRSAAIAVVYLVLVIGLGVVFSLVGEQVMQQGQKLMEQTPEWAQNINSGAIIEQLGAKHGWSTFTIQRLTAFLEAHRGEIATAMQNLVFRAARTVQNMWWLVLVPILAIFFLKDGHKIGDSVVNSIEDARNRRIVGEPLSQMNLMLGHYIRAQITLAGLAMVVVTFVLWGMRVQYAFALGPAAGALEFIPVVGPALGGLIVLAVAGLSGYNHVFWLLAFLVIWRVVVSTVS